MSHQDLWLATRRLRSRFRAPARVPRLNHLAGVLVTGVPVTGLLVTGLLLAGCAAPYQTVDLRITHRMYPQFKEQHAAAPGERFQVGDTDYSARIMGFVPDFVMDETTGKVSSRGEQPRNPAFQIEVFQADTLVERSWAFLKGSPPHFGRRSMLNFEVERIGWKPGQGPIDSTAAPDSLGSRGRIVP